MPIANTLPDLRCRFQEELLPAPTEFPGPLSERRQRPVAALEFATPERFPPAETRYAGVTMASAAGGPRRPWPVVHGEGGSEPADHAGLD